MKTLEIKNGKVLREGKVLVEEINLDLNLKETAVLFAKNGSGKTSFFYSLLGCNILDPNIKFEGSITYKGIEKQFSPNNFLNDRIYYVDSNVPPIEGITNLELWYSMYKIFNHNIEFNEFETLVCEKLNLLEIENSLIYNYIGVCSLGEKKILEIVPLTFLQFDLIVIDEIDSGVDQYYKKIIVDILKKADCAKLIITHDTNFAEDLMTNRYYTIEKGKFKCFQLN